QAALNAAPSTDLASATALDAEARLLTDAISKAAHQSAKPKGSTPRALPFWTADCKAMAADLHAAQDCLARSKRNRRPDPAAQCWVSSARESFLRTFRQARRAYYDRKIQDIASVGDISAFSRWRTRP